MTIYFKRQLGVFLFLLFSFISIAQDNVVEFTLEGNKKLIYNQTTKNGNSSVVLWDKKAKNQNAEIFNYDSDLELKYKKTFKSEFDDNSGFFGGGTRRAVVNYNMLMTDDGQYIFSATDEFILNNTGEEKAYLFNEKADFGNILGYLDFKTNNYACHFGPKIGKNKKPVDTDQFYLFTKNNDDLSGNTYRLPSVYLGEEGKRNLKIAAMYDDKFYTVTKDLNEEKTENSYTIVGYDYTGNVLSEVKIPVVLDKKFFMSSNNGGGRGIVNSYSLVNMRTGANEMSTTTHKLNQDSTGNIFVDEENGAFFIYGLYTNKKDKDFYNASYGGFYVHKYAFNGEVEWKLQKAIVDKNDFNKIAVAYFMEVNFLKMHDNTLNFTVSKSNTKQFAHFFTIDNSNGKIIKKEKVKFEVDKVRLAGMKKGCAFSTGYKLKNEFGKSNLDLISILASFLNSKVKDYLTSVKDDKLNYNASITNEGVYLIEENTDENKYRILKFKW